MRRALGCALRCLDPTYPDSPLGPSQDATYRRMAILKHPDKGGNHSECQLINETYEALKDDAARQEYNAVLANEGSSDGLSDADAKAQAAAMLMRPRFFIQCFMLGSQVGPRC